MLSLHKPSDQLKLQNPIIFRIASLVGILLIIILFLLYPREVEYTYVIDDLPDIVIEQVDIPETQQFERPAPPARPSIPIASESEEIADDLTLEEFSLEDFDPWDEAPPPPDSKGPRVKFIPYDDPPKPIGGYTAIHKNIVYPELAREAGIEGTVTVQFFVDKKGRVKETIVLKGVPNSGLDEAAQEAIRNTRFIPAKQRDRNVGVWISIPVNFMLHKSSM